MTIEEAIKLIENYEVNGCGYCHQGGTEIEKAFSMAVEALRCITVDAVPVIRCKDCKHRPIVIDAEGNGFDYDFPDERCPCQCEDGWYNWMPKDNWYCANGERKE